MPKRMLGIDVLTAARQRIEYVFDNFEKIYVSFSAGKDSTVMLHLVEDEARKRGRRFGVLLVDLEGQYQLTIEHAQKCLNNLKDITDQYWVCLPLALRNAVSVYQPKWQCWEPGKEDTWIRPLPPDAINNPHHFPFFQQGMEFEEFVPEFGEWYANGTTTACLVGIRADESLNRYRTIASTTKTTFKEHRWTSQITDHVYNAYPIYDWKTADIWGYHAHHPHKPYNHLYDRMAMAGLTIHQMRICQPYGDDQRRGLWLFHLIEPQTWARIVARVNGANSGALYNQEWGNINGYRRITKPPEHTWQTFAQLLINSMPPQMAEHYTNKILLFQQWWINHNPTLYANGIPDEAPYNIEAKRQALSWRRICKTLLRNDYWCKGIGFTQQKSAAYTAYQDLMRRRKTQWGVTDQSIKATQQTFQQ